MAEPRQTVERIRLILGAGASAADDPIRAVAEDFSALCAEANGRLKRCAEFLREGLATETVAHAHAAPPLTAFVQSLQFPEQPAWDRVCGELGLSVAPRLALSTLAECDAASQRIAPLAELLARHRYLALARADAGQRLAVLRQLMQADSHTPFWRADVEAMEHARLAILRNEAAVALRLADGAAMRRLLGELRETLWIVRPPAEVTSALSSAVQQAVEASALAQLRELLPRVHRAREAGDYDESRKTFADWGRVVRESRVSVPSALLAEIVPLAHWLDARDERRERDAAFAADRDALEATLGAALASQTLVERHARAAGHGAALPDELELRYRRALLAARRRERGERRGQLALAALLVSVTLVALLALVYVVLRMGVK